MKVVVREITDEGVMIASYGEKRSIWRCCQFCTTEHQIIPLTEVNNVLVCPDCGTTYKDKDSEVDTEQFFFFKMKTGTKYHISNTDKQKAITGREFDKGTTKKGKPKNKDEVCDRCISRLNNDYNLSYEDINS